MTRRSVPTTVPEGGWGWVVCLASCWTNGVVFGIINSFGVLYVVMLQLDGADAFRTSLIGSVCAGLTFFMAPFASIVTDKLGCRPAAVIGGALALAGVLGSSFARRIEHMYITYGFAMGLGFAIAYQPSLYILGLYFQKRLGVANGLVTFGSAIFTIVLPIAMREILTNYGLGPCLWFQSSIIFIMLAGGLTYRRPKVVQQVLDMKEDYGPELEAERREGRCKSFCKKVVDVSIWKERNYRVWAIGVPLGMFGYFVPFFHLVKHVNDTLPDARAEILIMCLGATSGIGRLVSGFLSDHPKINPIYLQQVAFLVIGVSTTLMPVLRNFIALCALILVMGIFDGAFVSMIGPIAFNLVGPQRASQAIGCVLGLMSIPMMIGPPVAGIIYDITGSYNIAFICSGVPPIVAACVLFLVRPEERRPADENNAEEGVDETEKVAMIPPGPTPAMAAKEAEALMDKPGSSKSSSGSSRSRSSGGGATSHRYSYEEIMMDDVSGNVWKGGLKGGRMEDGGFESGERRDDEHGRRRSYRRNPMLPEEARIIMHTHDLDKHNDDYEHEPQRRSPNGYHHANDSGYEAEKAPPGEDGRRSPYAQRNRNQNHHPYGHTNGKTTTPTAIANGHHKIELNGLIHRSDSQPNGVVTKLRITEKETTV